jgi:hypothetical protein
MSSGLFLLRGGRKRTQKADFDHIDAAGRDF